MTSGVLTNFLGLDSLELFLGKFPQNFELKIINYELIINKQILNN
jgi:hypothetical protein